VKHIIINNELTGIHKAIQKPIFEKESLFVEIGN